MKSLRRLPWFLGVLLLAGGGGAYIVARAAVAVPDSDRARWVREAVVPRLEKACRLKALRLGAPVFMRIFKESKELEVWIESAGGERFALFKTYPIATWGSGTLGPKLAQGDGQAPEGIYEVSPRQLNPNSKFHLAFNLGYPNGYDRALGRTGSALMVHGSDVSIGCYAMTDPGIEEIYMLADAALRGGQASFQVQCFPFRPTGERLQKEAGAPWDEFWNNLREGFDAFEATRRPPATRVENGRYVFN